MRRPPARLWNGLRARFAALALIRQPLVILIDHFDLVEPSCQQAVWRLHQLADSVGLKMTILLATRERQVAPVLQELVELRIEISSWTAAETAQFIQTAIRQAGSKQILFSDEACRSIHKMTHGVPSAVISLCSHCLLGRPRAGRDTGDPGMCRSCCSGILASYNENDSDGPRPETRTTASIPSGCIRPAGTLKACIEQRLYSRNLLLAHLATALSPEQWLFVCPKRHWLSPLLLTVDPHQQNGIRATTTELSRSRPCVPGRSSGAVRHRFPG